MPDDGMPAAACRDSAVQRRINDDPKHGDDRSWRERARNAEDAFKAAHAEIRQQRSTTAELLGRIRDLETADVRRPAPDGPASGTRSLT